MGTGRYTSLAAWICRSVSSASCTRAWMVAAQDDRTGGG